MISSTMKIVTLLSDFGLKDGYPAQMKGVILEKCPNAKIIDISHEIERHNIPMGSFVLETTVPHFPKGTIHVAVVDPGVGSDRKAIVIECESGLLVGPDNGLMARASEKLGLKSIRQIQEGSLDTKPISTTFHGRDIFARVAGMLVSGKRLQEIGERVSRIERLSLAPALFAEGKLTCQVLYVDHFGNVITNAEDEHFRKIKSIKEKITIRSEKGEFRAIIAKSYHELGPDSVGVLMGSQGYLEIAVRERSASEELDLKSLDELEFRV
jgi:S-adenosyl-L-methionine hydrolase (adenosine-forming)